MAKQKKQSGFFSEPIFLIAMAIIASFALAAPQINSPDSAVLAVQHQYDLTTQTQQLRFLLDQEIAYDLNLQITPTACTIPDAILLGPFLAEFNAQTDLTCHYRNTGSGPFNDPLVFFSNSQPISIEVNCLHDQTGTSIIQALSFQKKVSFGTAAPTTCCTVITDLQSDQNDFDLCGSQTTPPGSEPACTIELNPDSIYTGTETANVHATLTGFTSAPAFPPSASSCGNGNEITGIACNQTDCTGTCGSYSTAGEYTVSLQLLDGSNPTPIDCTQNLSVTDKPANLVAQWKFENNFNDSLGAFDLTPSAGPAPEFAEGKINQKSVFLESKDDSTVGAYLKNGSTALDLQNKSFSIAFWYKSAYRTGPSAQTIFSHCQNSAEPFQCLKITANSYNTISFGLGSGSSSLDSNMFATNPSWVQVVATFNASTKKRAIFIDGRQDSTDGSPLNQTYQGNTSNICLGTYCEPPATPSEYDDFNGFLDEFRIYDRVISPTEILDLYHQGEPHASEEAEWKFEEKQNNKYKNTKTGQFDLISYGLTDVPGRQGNAIQLKESENRFGLGSAVDFRNTGFTVTAWVNLSSSGNNTLLSQCPVNGNNRCLKMLVKRDYLSMSLSGATEELVYYKPDWTAMFSANTWHHVAFVFDNTRPAGSKGRIFLDGIQLAPTVNTIDAYYGNPGPVCLGVWCMVNIDEDIQPGSIADFFKGKMDNARIYLTPLTSGQIAAEANEGKPAPTPLGEPFSRWEFNETGGNIYANAAGPDYNLIGNGTNLAAGLTGNALSTNEIPEIPFSGNATTASELDLTNKSFSISQWYRPYENSYDYINTLFSQCPDPETTNDACLKVKSENGQIMFAFNNAENDYLKTNADPYFIRTNAWNYIVTTFDNAASPKRRAIYVNGQKVADDVAGTGESSGPTAGYGVPTSNICVGKLCTFNTDYAKGRIDNLMVWNKALSSAEVQGNYAAEKPFEGPFKRYSFEEQSITGAYKDNISGAFDLATQNAAKVIDRIPGTATDNNVLEYTGQSDPLIDSFSRGPIIGLAGKSYSVSLWIKPRIESGNDEQNLFTLCNRMDMGNRCMEIRYQNGYDTTDNLLFYSGIGASALWEAVIPQNAWTHIVLDNNYSDILNPVRTLYVNKNSITPSWNNSPVPFEGAPASFCLATKCYQYFSWPPVLPPVPGQIDNYATHTQFFRGRMDEVRIYTKALTQTEINCLFATPGAACGS